MAPENEGKPPAALIGSTVEVRYEDMQDMQTTLANMQTKVQDVMSKLTMSVVEAECQTESGEIGSASSRRCEEVRGYVKDLEYASTCGQLVQLKLGNLAPRIKGPDGAGESDVLKRSRPISQTLSRLPSLVDSKLNILCDGTDGILKGSNTGYDASNLAPGDNPPLKFIRTENNTKAAYQKPQIYMPTAKLGVPILDGPTSGEPHSLSSGGILAKSPTSPKKRPPRGKRDRNRAKNKVAAIPEPVMQRLMPGDTNKIPEDGYLWRKYGNKPIKTASYKRGYYKCRHFKEQVRCNATKIVQQTNNDPSTFSVCYKGEHTCQQGKLGNRSLNGVSRGDSDATLADQVQNNANNGGGLLPGTDGDRDDTSLLDQMDWPNDDDDGSEASDMEFVSDEGAEEANDNIAMVPASDVELAVATPPASPPLLDFAALENLASDNMLLDPPLASIAPPEQPVATWEPEPLVETISVPDPAVFTKSKYQSIDTLDEQVEKGMMNMTSQDDNDQDYLLGIIQGGAMDDFNDIHFWSSAFDQAFATDAF